MVISIETNITCDFGHTFANSAYPDETAPYEPSQQDFHYLLR